MTLEMLKVEYEKDILLDEMTIDRQVISLPKIMAKYQFFYHDVLQAITILEDSKEKTYYEMYTDYKMGNGDLKNLSLSGTELKKLLETNPTYRDISFKLSVRINELKLTEEMMSNIKNIGFAVNNYLTYKKIMLGDV